jgi:hypothetical protein
MEAGYRFILLSNTFRLKPASELKTVQTAENNFNIRRIFAENNLNIRRIFAENSNFILI